MPNASPTLACETMTPADLEPEDIVPEELIELDDGREDDSATHQIETVVRGYRIGSLIGRGGMSVVFRVTHAQLEQPLAMKVMTDPRMQNELAASAIYAHAKTMTMVSNAHVVRTLDAGRLPSGEPFVVMERLEGEDLAEHLRQHGAVPIADAIGYAMQACDGLAAAHAAGIVHGDIKPGNLLLTRDFAGAPCLKIIDFAPAVPRASGAGDPLVTCSPGYASPEQLGARVDVDARADVWALGAVLYELVTGRRAFEATTLAETLKAIALPPPSVRAARQDASAELDAVIRRCLTRDRESRYADVRFLRDALRSVLAANDMRMPTAVPRARVSPRLRRSLLLGALGPACALVSMTLVRLIMASHFHHAAAAPSKWPTPIPLTALNSPGESAP